MDGSKIRQKVVAAYGVLLDGNVLHKRLARLEYHRMVFQAQECVVHLYLKWLEKFTFVDTKIRINNQAAILITTTFC